MRSKVAPAHGKHNRHRLQAGRLYLVGVFILLRLTDAGLLFYTFLPTNPVPHLRGFTIGSLVWTTALLIGMWRRQAWARYILIGCMMLFIAVFSIPVLQALGQMDPAASSPYFIVVHAIALYAVAITVLIRSRRLRHLASISGDGRA